MDREPIKSSSLELQNIQINQVPAKLDIFYLLVSSVKWWSANLFHNSLGVYYFFFVSQENELYYISEFVQPNKRIHTFQIDNMSQLKIITTIQSSSRQQKRQQKQQQHQQQHQQQQQ